MNEFLPSPPAPTEEKRVSRGRRNRPAVDIGERNDEVAKSTEDIKKQGWNSEAEIERPSKVGRRAVPAIPAQDKRKTVVNNLESTDVIENIPDLLDGEEDNNNLIETNSIAAAPVSRNEIMIRSLADLESDSNLSLSQVQVATIPGLDLSKLIANCLLPISQVDEMDAKWEWDTVFTQVVTELENF